MINYQAVVRDANGNVVNGNTNGAVGIQITILQSSATGTQVYKETFTPTPNSYGLVNFAIGTGTVVSGTFSSIDWGNNSYWIKTEYDLNGGTSYTISGESQFYSVPYALYANSSGGSITDNDGDTKIQLEESTDEDIIRFDTKGEERFLIGDDGNIQLNSDNNFFDFADVSGSNLSTGIRFINNSGGYDGIIGKEPGQSGQPGYIFIGENFSEKTLVISNDDNVGIGNLAPDERLVITSGNILLDNDFHYMGKMTGGTKVDLIGIGSGDEIFIGRNSVNNINFGGSSGGINNRKALLTFDAKFGIGLGITPITTLDVSGGARIGSNYAGDITIITDPTDGLIVEGSVGIGTSDPQAKLEVDGEARLSDATDMGTNDASLATKKYVDDNAGGGKWVNSSDPGYETTVVLQDNLANVGVGTTMPDEKLEIDGTVKIKNSSAINSTLILDNDDATTSSYSNVILTNSNVDGSEKMFELVLEKNEDGTISTSGETVQDRFIIRKDANYFNANPASNISYLTIESSEYELGIMTEKPHATLSVNGNMAIGSEYAVFDFATEENDAALPANSLLVEGKTGLGTKYPQSKLHVVSDNSSSVIWPLTLQNITTGENGTGIKFHLHGSNGMQLDVWSGVAGVMEQSQGGFYNGTSTGLAFYTKDNDPAPPAAAELPTERMRIDNAGNVGIGTSSPDYKLDVRGNISLMNETNTKTVLNIINNNSAQYSRSSLYFINTNTASGSDNVGFSINYEKSDALSTGNSTIVFRQAESSTDYLDYLHFSESTKNITFNANKSSGSTATYGNVIVENGNTNLGGELNVTGATTLSSTLDVIGTTGIDGNFDINTNKFTVNATTGNTTIAGDMHLTGAIYDPNNQSGTSGQVLSSTASGTDWIDGSDLGLGDITEVAAGDGLVDGGTTGSVTLNVGAGTGIDVSTNQVSVDVSDFMSNGTNNELITATGTDAMISEANLTFDGSTLNVTGDIEASGTLNTAGIEELSDKRWKKDVIKIENALEKVMSMNGVYYNWRKDEFPEKGFTDNKQVGFIAQELEDIFPEVVNTDDEGYKSVMYGHVVALLVEAIKDLESQLDLKTTTLEEKTKEIDEIQASLEEIRKVLGLDIQPIVTDK